MRVLPPPGATLAFAVVACSALLPVADAHKPITSPFTYHEDVLPILRAQCGACHVEGGVGPMSLLTHAQTVPWGESIRAELLAGHMPPWTVEGSLGRFQNAQGLTARELNILLTWVSGGTPPGDPAKAPPVPRTTPGWRLGAPDLELPLPPDYTLAADVTEATEEFTIATGLREDAWLRAVDLLPGNTAIVRSASVRLKGSGPPAGSGPRPESVLAIWAPGDLPVALDGEGAFRLPADAELIVSINYRKSWEYERQAATDRSTIGLYLAPAPAPQILALVLEPESPDSAPAAIGDGPPPAVASARRDGIPALRSTGTIVSYTTTVQQDLRALAIYPDATLTDARLTAIATRPDGTTEELIAFRPRSGWARRYWFARPIALPRGTRIEVSAELTNPLLPPGALPPAAPEASAIRLTLNAVQP